MSLCKAWELHSGEKINYMLKLDILENDKERLS